MKLCGKGLQEKGDPSCNLARVSPGNLPRGGKEEKLEHRRQIKAGWLVGKKETSKGER